MVCFFDWRKRNPSTGMSPRIGIFDSPWITASRTRPPITTVCWSRTMSVVFAVRLLIGTAPSAPCAAPASEISSVSSSRT